MFVLRATAKLQKRLKAPLHADPGKSTTALGDWYANIIYLERRPLILAASEKSLLAVLLPARDLSGLPRRFPDVVRDRLLRLGVPAAVADREAGEMAGVVVAPTASRSTLAVLSHMARDIRFMAPVRPGWGSADWESYFEEYLFAPLGLKYPRDAALECLRRWTN
jgi:hypothetical protein